MKKRTTLIALFAVVLLLPLTAAAQTLQDSIPSTLVELLQQKDVAALKGGIATLQSSNGSSSSNDLDTKTTILLLIVLIETLLICIYPYRRFLFKKKPDKATPTNGDGGATPEGTGGNAVSADGGAVPAGKTTGNNAGSADGGASPAGKTTKQPQAAMTKRHCILDKLRSLFTKKTVETPIDGKATMTDPSQSQSASEPATDDSEKDREKDNEITRLKAEVEKYKDAAGVLAIVRERLGIESSDKDETIITKLEALIDKASKGISDPTAGGKSSQSEEPPSPATTDKGEVLRNLAGEIWSLADKSANSDIKKLKSDALGDSDPVHQITTFVSGLIEKLKNYSHKPPADGARDFKSELNKTGNQNELKLWVIDQLSSIGGYKGFDDRKNISRDALFKEIVGKLRQADAPQEAAEGDGQAKEDDKPTEEQKKTVLQEVIDKINDKLSGQGQAEKTLNNNDIDTFIDEVVGVLSRPADISEAEATERKKNLELINKVFKSSLQDLDEQNVKKVRDAWLLGNMNEKINGLQAPDLGRLYEILRAAIKSSDELKALLDSYGAKSKDEIEKKIREKDYENLRKSVSDKLQALIPDKPVETTEKLVRALIKVAEDGRDNVQLIVEELKKEVAAYTHADATGSTATELVDEYSRCVEQREKELRDDIASKDKTIADNNVTIGEQKATITTKEAEIQEKCKRINDLLSDSTTMGATLRSFAQQLSSSQSPLLDPCSGRDAPACAHANKTLKDAITTFTQQLMTFTVDGNTSPRVTKQQIQEMLTSFLTDPSSAVSILCRYYAYSNLPFMSDSQRKYGALINVSAAHEQYTLIARLYATFSITLIVPALFAHGVDTTPYIALSGAASSALSFLCPQVVNHKGTMDTSVSPRAVVYDIVRVGYAIDEKIQTQPEVITF